MYPRHMLKNMEHAVVSSHDNINTYDTSLLLQNGAKIKTVSDT
jgi:hypothetical protein